MSALASLLVRDQVIPVDRIQEAIQQQVMRGGNLDTVLLELGELGENQMNAYCAAVFGLLPASRDEIMLAPLDTTRTLPREFAVRHRVIPVARTEETVVLAVDRPLADEQLREISIELGVDPVQRVACTVRIEAGLAQHYDIELTTRMRQLAEELERTNPGAIPYVAPFEGAGKRSSLPPLRPTSGPHRRIGTTPPHFEAVRDSRDWTRGTTAPPSSSRSEPQPSGTLMSAEPQVSASIPAGTFRDRRPLQEPTPEDERDDGFSSPTRYSLPPRDAEVLGRPEGGTRASSRPPATRSSSQPSGPPESPDPWTPVPQTSEGRADPATQWRSRSTPPDPRRDNDGSSLVHDVVHLGDDVPSHAPPSEPTASPRRSSKPPVSERSLPSVIVDVGDEVEVRVEELRRAAPEDEMLILPLLAAGEAALPALVREFPGRLWFDRNQPYAKVPEGRDISPVARALVAFGQMSVPYLIPLLDHKNPDVRYYATVLASEFVHPDLVEPIGHRLFDVDAGVRGAAYRALSVLYACADEFDALMMRLRATARDSRNLAVQIVALESLGRLRDVDSFEFLVSMLSAGSEEVVRAAHASLVRLSCQDFGTSRRKWKVWFQRHSTKHRIEWLIEALVHSDERLRRRANDELKHLTQEYFGYEPDLSRREREEARKKYQRWWDQVGRRMFTHPDRPDPGHLNGG